MIISDHGFKKLNPPESYYWPFRFNSILEKIGLLEFKGVDINWAETLVYSKNIGTWKGSYFKGLNLNIKRREPQGIISKKEYNRYLYLEQVKDLLRDIKYFPSKRKLLEFISFPIQGKEKYDIYIRINEPSFRDHFLLIKGKKYPLSILFDYGQMTGYHEGYPPPPGVFIVSGPGLKKGYMVKDIDIFDIFPTILYIFRLPVPLDIKGDVVKKIFIGRQDFGYRTISSYENAGNKVLKTPQRSELDEEILEKLRSLGYIN
jgi:predicted AlkP superfamily phosphohydrolase/phosphomutase